MTAVWRWSLRGMVLVLGAIVALVLLGHLRGWSLHIEAGRRSMELVGSAGVRFLCQTGTNPRSLDELIDAGLLRVMIEPDGDRSVCSQGFPPIPMKDVERVRLVFPAPALALTCRRDGPELTLVTCAGVPHGVEHEVNARLVVEWRRCVEASEAASRPGGSYSEP